VLQSANALHFQLIFMKKYSKQKCLEIIDDCLNNREGILWTVERFMKKLKVGKRSIHNYINELKSLQAPIKFTKNKGYFYSASFKFKKPTLNEDEATKLYAAINILKELNFFTPLFDLESLVLKLESTSVVEAQVWNTIVQFEQHVVLKGWKEYFDKLFMAIKDKKVISVTYQRFHTKKVKTYNFHPYLLKEYHNRWYLFGKIDGKENITTLALDRIENIQYTDIAYEKDRNFDAGDHFASAIGITFEGNITPQKISIRVIKKQVPYFENQPLHTSQKTVKVYKNGDKLFSLFVIINIELKLLLMQYAHTLKVMEPESLRISLNEMLQNAVKLNVEK